MMTIGIGGQSERICFAHSPCPNDTFAFHALASDPRFTIQLAGIEELNRAALAGRHDVTKLSLLAFFRVRATYAMLRSGAALGRGCGPLLVARDPAAPLRRVAAPGELTTANLLLELWAPAPLERVQMRHDEIVAAVARGEVEAGVVIHESRFTYAAAGLAPVVDLGAWWEETTARPLPLAVIAARRSLGPERIAEIEAAVRSSVMAALREPEVPLTYVRHHAQELADGILRRHIATFVTDHAVELGKDGEAAIEFLESMARAKGLVA